MKIKLFKRLELSRVQSIILFVSLIRFIAKYVLCGKCKIPEYAFSVEKKDLMAICNACGYQKKLDNTHKAGKQMIKDMSTFYSNNPEFKGKS